MVLVQLGVEGADEALAVGIVEGVIDGGGCDAEAGGGDAIDHEGDGASAGLLIGGHVFEHVDLFQLRDELVGPLVQLVHVRIFQRVLILGAADAVVDGDVLHRLHVEVHAGDVAEFVLQAANDIGRVDAAGRTLIERLEVDGDAAAVERGIDAVGADEGGKTFDGGVAQDDVGELLLFLRHGVEGDILRRLGDALDHAGILHREEAFGDDDIEEDGEHQGAQSHEQSEGLVAQHDPQGAPVKGDHAVEHVLRYAVEARLLLFRIVAQDAGAHHGGEGERDHRGDDDGDGQGDGKFAEEAAHDVTHEEQRDKHRDERHGQRNDGEADLTRAGERRLHGAHAFFEVARDVLDHHDGVVDHEAGGDGEGHQREVVEAVAEHIHRGEGADERERHGHAGNDGGVQIAQEEEDDQHHQTDGEHQLELDIVHRGLDAGGHVGEGADANRRGEIRFQLGKNLLDAANDGDGVGAGLALDVEDDGRRLVHPRGLLGVLDAIHDSGDVMHEHRSAVAVGDDHVVVLAGLGELIVGVDLVILAGAVEIAFGGVDAGADERGTQVLHVEAVGRQLDRVCLDADRRFLAAADTHQADAGDLGDLGREARVDQVFHLRERHESDVMAMVRMGASAGLVLL